MGRFRGRAFHALVIALATTASGCVGAAQHRGEPLAGWPPPAGPTSLAVNFIAVADDRQVPGLRLGSLDTEDGMRKGVRRALEECRGIRMSESGAQAWDRRAVFSTVIVSRNETQAMVTIFLCGFTLFLSPAVIPSDIQMSARIYDGDGKEMGEFHENGSESEYVELFLLFVFPFWTDSEAYEDECYELARRIVLAAMKAGVL